MSKFNYTLDSTDYTWTNALLWGNCIGHWDKAISNTSQWSSRIVHVLIVLVETLPIISQIASIFEKIIVEFCGEASKPALYNSSKSYVIKNPERGLQYPLKQEENRNWREELDKQREQNLKIIEEVQKKVEEMKFDLFNDLKKKISAESSMNCLAMHLLMDKFFVKETELEGMADTVAIRDLTRAIRRFKENEAGWLLEEPLKEWLRPFLQSIFSILERAWELSGLRIQLIFRTDVNAFEAAKKNYVDKVWEYLKELEVGQSLLIPIGCKQHDTILLVKKLTSSSFRLIHYNTGYGLDHHYRYNDTRLYQTHDILDEVPAESILNEEEWKAHFLELLDKKDMNFAYDWIRNHIGKGGALLPASTNEEEYEAVQLAGTCSTQSKMAWLRHEIMQAVPGTIAEKEAAYKIIKTHFFLQFIQDNENKFDEPIKKYLPSIIEKLKAEQALFQIARSEQETQEAIKAFNEVLSKMNDKVNFESSPNELSVMGRYALLRKYSLILFRKLRAEPNLEIPPDLISLPALNFVMAKFKHYVCIKANIVTLLDHLAIKDDEAFADKLTLILINSLYGEIGMTEAVKHLAKELPTAENPPKKSEHILTFLEESYELNTPLVEKLSKALHENGNQVLADWISDNWKSRKED